MPKYKAVVFVNGCFWHGHEGCPKFHFPDSNAEFWRNKILGNKERDTKRQEALEASGWTVIVVWECELENKSFKQTLSSLIERIEAAKQ